ncbi:MAG: META domain-containing protein [Gammaproteobacteria bacterium]|nr:META domain-containing protein [Gammaproteobacteria bacterium]
MRNSLTVFLILVLNFISSTASSQEILLEGSSWQLSAIHGLNNSEFIPPNPQNYLLRFRMDNRLQIEADCNQGGATWGLEENFLTLAQLITTRKICLSPSLFNRYVMNLIRAETAEISDDKLIIRTDSEANWMEFEPYIFTPNF